MKIALSSLALTLALSTVMPGAALADEYSGSVNLPAVFAFRCDNLTSDPHIKTCPPLNDPTDPYGDGGGKLVHWTHSWLQVHNTSGVAFEKGDELRLYLYGKDGKPIDVDDSGCAYPIRKDGTLRYIDVLNDVAKGNLPKNGTAFLFIERCLNDGKKGTPVEDKNPPTSGKLELYKSVKGAGPSKLQVQVHAGWEEGAAAVHYGHRHYAIKAGTLVDKEKVDLSKK